MKQVLCILGLVLVSAVSLAAEKIVRIDGSSTVYPINEAMAEEFQIAQKGKIKVTVGVSGTGGGFKKFCRGELDITGASRPITESEMKTCAETKVKYYELPIAFDATVVVVHPSNPMTEITVEELKKIWSPDSQGKITQWNQVNAKWPANDLKLFGAGADSGTFDYFTEAIVGKAKSSRGDYTASEDDNILVKGVAGNKGALGYLPLAYYLENKSKLKALAIINKDGKAVLPARETVEASTYNPLSRPLFIYVNAESAKQTEIKEFIKMYFEQAATIVPQVKYVPLPAKAYSTAADHFNKGKLGTVFKGHAGVGMTVEELLKKEAAL